MLAGEFWELGSTPPKAAEAEIHRPMKKWGARNSCFPILQKVPQFCKAHHPLPRIQPLKALPSFYPPLLFEKIAWTNKGLCCASSQQMGCEEVEVNHKYVTRVWAHIFSLVPASNAFAKEPEVQAPSSPM